MKKTLLILLVLAAWFDILHAGPTYKLAMITSGDTAIAVRHATVDLIKNAIQNDPYGQLPGTWMVDLIPRTSVSTVTDSAWRTYALIMTWGMPEGSNQSWDASLAVLDTIHRPVMSRDAFVSDGSPMRLGTASYLSNTPLWFRVKNTTHFITNKTYLRQDWYGDSLRLYTSGDYNQKAHAIRGMANGVVTLVKYAGDRVNGDADTALVVIADSGVTRASGGASPHRRIFFGLASDWTYNSFAAKMMFYRAIRWAMTPQDITIDTCITTVPIAREGTDGSFLEKVSTSPCQGTWHYGGFTSGFLTGSDVVDRVMLLRARTGAIKRQLPDTTTSLAYDIVDTKLTCYVQAIAKEHPLPFSCWEGIFEILHKNSGMWLDNRVSVQLDPTCGSWVDSDPDTLMNSTYFKYPTVPWASQYAGTRGTDYSMLAYDSIFIQDPVPSNLLIWSHLQGYIINALDSTQNQGLCTHTIGTVQNDGEVTVSTEIGDALYSRIMESPRFDIILNWRAANNAPADLDSTLAFSPDSTVFQAYVNQDLTNKVIQVYNSGSNAVFSCSAIDEHPAVSWGNISLNLGNGVTTFYLTYHVDITGLSAGYYYTWLVPTCQNVVSDSTKIILDVLPVPSRRAGGSIQWAE